MPQLTMGGLINQSPKRSLVQFEGIIYLFKFDPLVHQLKTNPPINSKPREIIVQRN